MREDVCTVLNEREPFKQQMAAALEEQLSARGLSNTRLEAVGNIAQVLIKRQPRVVILDYVLGDVATALDIISALRAQFPPSHIQIIVWTDDPSVSVAVSAIKLGADDYVQLGLTVSLERVIQSIEHSLSMIHEPATHTTKRGKTTGDELVANSPALNKLLQLAEGVAARDEPAVVLLGESGVGRSSIGKFIHEMRSNPGQLIEIDFDLFQGSAAEIAGSDSLRHIVPRLSYCATVVIDHIEFDDGELLTLISERQKQLFSASNEKQPMLIAGTTSPETAQAWNRILGANVLTVPPLREREDDFWPLMQQFASELKGGNQAPRISLTPAIARELSKLPWPGNVRQLRAATIEALSTAPRESKGRGENNVGDLSKSDSSYFNHVNESRLRWEEQTMVTPWIPSPVTARNALQRAAGNFRIAAALLGTGIPQLHQAVNPTVSTHEI